MTFDYNSLNLITSQVDEGGYLTEYKYDVWSNQTYRNEHNSNGNISGDQIWNISYNAFNQPVKEEKNDGTSWSYEYNGRGLLTKKKDPKGIALTNVYDECGRLKSETRAFNGKTEIKTYEYDANGFMNEAHDGFVASYINGQPENYIANAYNLVTSLETTVSGKKLNTSYTYDDALNMTGLLYSDGTNINYSYNALGQLTAITNGNTNYASDGTYDSLGRLVSLKAGNGKVTSRTWDAKHGTLNSYNWNIGDYVKREITWDNLGNITSIVKGTENKKYTNTYEYDCLNRLTKEKNGADADITTKKLDKLNFKYVNNDIICDKNGEYVSDAVHFDYNAGSAIVDLGSRQKLSSLKVYGKNNRISPEYLEIWLSEDGIEWNQLTTVSWQNDTEGLKAAFTGDKEKSEPTARYVKLHFLWDERDQDYAPVDKSTFRGNLWNLFEVSFTANGKENFYTYDARGNRLIENEKYGGNSNSTSTEYFYYENSDLIKKAGTWYFNYDKNGNLIARGTNTVVSNGPAFSAWTFSDTEGELWTYEYDLQNRMVKASYSDKGSANLKERSSYVYDYRSLLVKKTYKDYIQSGHVEVMNEESASSIIEYYEYTPDGKLLYTENSASASTNYIWANQTLWCEINEGVVYYHHSDHLGTTEVITDTSGKVVWSADYEAFGSVLSERGDPLFTPSYTGKFFDKSSGLYYFNARWYDSELGRFTTQDPIRDGMNWYAYCNNSSLIYTDQDGKAVVVYMKFGLFGGNENEKYAVRSQTYFEKIVFDKVQAEMYPIMGDELVNLSYLMSGEHKIADGNNETSVTDIALSTISISGDLKLSKGLIKAGKVAGWISNIKFGFGLFKSYKNDILNCAIEELTCDLFSYEMASDSPDVSEKLYKFANKEMNRLYNSGRLNIDYNSIGSINDYYAKDPSDIEIIRNDLNNYKKELKYGLPNE